MLPGSGAWGGSVGLWVCGSVGLWVCGSVGLWVCGSVGLWVCGSVGAYVGECFSAIPISKKNLKFQISQDLEPDVSTQNRALSTFHFPLSTLNSQLSTLNSQLSPLSYWRCLRQTEQAMIAPPLRYLAGTTPLLISIPHSGTQMPESIAERLTPDAAKLPDTDWHLDRLYERFSSAGASVIAANYSRYVVDLNRPPDDQRLYKTATTGLFPRVQFDGNPIYRTGLEPEPAELQERLDTYYWPYHRRLASVLEEIRGEHGYAVLFDAHSILSRVPRLFDGQLPDLNLGTNDGHSCNDSIADRLLALLQRTPQYSHVVNGRFKGGYITRHYGQPEHQIHAVQLEIAQSTYMREDGQFRYEEAIAERFLPFLTGWIRTLLGWNPS